MIFVVPMFAMFAAAGCAPSGPDDALTQTWHNTSCFGSSTMPADIQSCTTTLHFDSELTFTLTDTRQALPATQMYPRCVTTRRVTGQRYSTNNNTTFTLTGTSTSTMERTGCVNQTDNSAEAADSTDSVPAGDSTYSINAAMLTISTGALSGTYEH